MKRATRKFKISILTPDFSNNCFGRPWLLAKLLQRHYDVEMIGPALPKGIWEPLRNACDFETKVVKAYRNGRFEFTRMLNMISGDVIYPSKPLTQSFGVGIVKKIRTRKPLVLDIDDWELGFGKESYASLNWPKKILDFILFISKWRSYPHALLLDRLIRFSNDITVSGERLQARYGGTVIWHGRDVHIFDPKRYDKTKLKKKHLPGMDEALSTIGFIGTARPHKGLEDLIEAIAFLDNKNILLMIVGTDDDQYCATLKKKTKISSLKSCVTFFPQQPFENLPEFLSIADLIVIPQRIRSASYGQVPAKIFDAMAMAKPIIATNVSDIPQILNGCGWVSAPEDPEQLATTIEYVLAHPEEARRRGKKAREKCKKEYSWETMEERLVKVFEKLRTR